MGRIIFETDLTTHEIEKSDEEILSLLQSLTGIKVAFKKQRSTLQKPIEPHLQKEGTRPFSREALPSMDELIEYVRNHLDGFSIPMSLENFFGYIPRYNSSKFKDQASIEQNKLLGTYSGRLFRARQEIERSKGGKFEEDRRGTTIFYAFKKNIFQPNSYLIIKSDDKTSEINQNEEQSNQDKSIVEIPEVVGD